MNLLQDYVFVFAVITFVTLCATFVVLVLHKNNAHKSVHSLDFRTIAIQLLTITIWVKLLTVVISDLDKTTFILEGILMLLATVFGVFLIRATVKGSMLREDINNTREQQKTVNDRLRQIDKQRTDFLSLTSHQLRGPYASIKGYTSLILEGEYGEIPESMQGPIMKISESARNLGFLLNDFLDVAKIEQGELDFKIVTTDITNILDTSLNEFASEFARKDIELIRTYNNKEDIYIEVDPNRVQQALAKIIDNALKYTSSGSVQVSLAVKDHDAIITVKDSGIGIGKEEMQIIFKKFTRMKSAGELAVYGNGLGLYVAKEMIESQHGKLWVDSPGPGKGATFFIALPLAK